MTKEEILDNALPDVIEYPHYNLDNFQRSVALDAMDVFAKQEAFLFSEFKKDYQRIEGMNVRHHQNENFGGQIYSWIGASNEVIWEAYKKGEQLKRYFEK